MSSFKNIILNSMVCAKINSTYRVIIVGTYMILQITKAKINIKYIS